MKKTINFAVTLAAAVAICFALVSLLQSAPPPHAGPKAEPIWEITEANWVDHAPNTRFAIWDVEGDNITDPGPEAYSNDVVLDKETGLVWARDADLLGGAGEWAGLMYADRELFEGPALGGRNGWRIATVEEFGTLHAGRSNPALPLGHPFINVVIGSGEEVSTEDMYWTSTTSEGDSTEAYVVEFLAPRVWRRPKMNEYHIWPVRGGNGYATASWALAASP
jgi:hypothetical protein